jgi:hypothetical protein
LQTADYVFQQSYPPLWWIVLTGQIIDDFMTSWLMRWASHVAPITPLMFRMMTDSRDLDGLHRLVSNLEDGPVGQDWHDELKLLSGNPVTFRQAVFESYYVKRPSVPVEVAGRVLPSHTRIAAAR